MDKEKYIIQSWQANAQNWIRLIESNGIESRKLVTNKAIFDKIISYAPASVLDLGCGEGWLSKQLYDHGIKITGVDSIPELIEKATEKMPGNFHVASYQQISSHKVWLDGPFDAVVINFALIGKESTEHLLTVVPEYLSDSGKLFIQTLHPQIRIDLNDYFSGWKHGSWDGLGDEFTTPYEWYFRTTEDWINLLLGAGFHSIETLETTHPISQKPLSIIFTCARR